MLKVSRGSLQINMEISLKRIYESPSRSDGIRILVERLWPRGVAKAQARVDHWWKVLAPSPELRQWFSHDPRRWQEFKLLYYEELEAKKPKIRELVNSVGKGPVTFLFASRETTFNNAVALKEYLEKI